MRTVPLLALLALLIASTAAAATGGPDALGYTFIDSGEAGGPSYSWSGGGNEISVPDNGSTTVSIPFSFEFYGVGYTQVQVGDDGILTFGGASPGASNSCLPTLAVPGIAPWWDDWDSDEGEVLTRTDGSSPDRVFVITWDDIEHGSTENSADFQVKLFENSTAIEFHYRDASIGGWQSQGGSATVGIDAPGVGSLEYSCDSQTLSNNFAIRFEVTCFGVDGDAFWDCVDDCDDSDSGVWPGAPETCGDGVDQDC